MKHSLKPTTRKVLLTLLLVPVTIFLGLFAATAFDHATGPSNLSFTLYLVTNLGFYAGVMGPGFIFAYFGWGLPPSGLGLAIVLQILYIYAVLSMLQLIRAKCL